MNVGPQTPCQEGTASSHFRRLTGIVLGLSGCVVFWKAQEGRGVEGGGGGHLLVLQKPERCTLLRTKMASKQQASTVAAGPPLVLPTWAANDCPCFTISQDAPLCCSNALLCAQACVSKIANKMLPATKLAPLLNSSLSCNMSSWRSCLWQSTPLVIANASIDPTPDLHAGTLGQSPNKYRAPPR